MITRHFKERCAGTGAYYLAIVEDDVLTLDGWFHRVKRASGVAGVSVPCFWILLLGRGLKPIYLSHPANFPSSVIPSIILHRRKFRLDLGRVAALSLLVSTRIRILQL